VSAAIQILEDFERRRVPLKTAIADWARNARFAGAKDRAWISGLCLDVLRRRSSLSLCMENDTPRAQVLCALKLLWRKSLDEIRELASEEPHGPGVLTDVEAAHLSRDIDDFGKEFVPESGSQFRSNPPFWKQFDYPEWLHDSIVRAFGRNLGQEMSAFAARADIDLRINTLQASPEKALGALKTFAADQQPFVKTAARIPAPDAADRAPPVTIIPAFNKGWVEIQDLGSQVAALAAGNVKNAQVLDFCAGGGGKTLALAALMENKGQLYAYDSDARRLQPLYERARRAGVRNLQIVNPLTDKAALGALSGKMDVVFIDAPCTGSGTWRRHPDTKWRLTEDQLARRMYEQDVVLREAAPFAKPGGRIVYVTCSFLLEENEDRLSNFISANGDFEPISAIDEIAATGLLTDQGRTAIGHCETSDGALRLTPARFTADGFFVAVLQRKR
jgi:16S rRNA (cytosine967-C5)-methyltransferase